MTRHIPRCSGSRLLGLLILSLLFATPSTASPDSHANATPPTQEPILLWPNDPERNSMAKLGKAVKGDGGKTRVSDIATPHLIPYLVKDADAPRPTVILCPGGGYVRLVPSLHWPIAEWLNEQGFNAFILMYRCPSSREGKPTPDLQRAIRMVRSNAKAWNVDPKRLGVLGSSAGGNLCVRASIGFESDSYEPVDAIDEQSARPDFTVLLYPAYIAKRGTQEPSDWVQVPADTPPTLIITAKDDKGHYANSPVYEAALKAANIPVTAYYYDKGGHGFGMNHPATKTWPDRWLAWMKEQGVIEEAKKD